VLDQEGVRADAAIGVPHFAHSDPRTRAEAKGTGALCGTRAWPQEALRKGHAGQKVNPASAHGGAAGSFLYRLGANATVQMQGDWNGVRLPEPWAGVGGGIASAQVIRQYLTTWRTMLMFFAWTLKNVSAKGSDPRYSRGRPEVTETGQAVDAKPVTPRTV
jgi:hypothetical protein